MTESVKFGSEGKYTIGLIDKDRIKYIKAMNTERDLTLTMIHPIHLRACATPSIRGLRTS